MKILKCVFFVGLLTLGLFPTNDSFASSELEKLIRSDLVLLKALKSINYSPLDPPTLTVTKKENIDVPIESREYTSYELNGEGVDSIKFAVSQPSDMKPGESLPVIIVVAGYQTGEDVVNFINEPGRNIIVGFDYSLPQRIENLAFKRDVDILLRLPIKIASLVRWLNTQQWAESEKISILSVSFGTFFVPAAQRISEMERVQVKATVLAYGGGDFKKMLYQRYPNKLNPKELRMAGALVTLLTSIIDPVTHLPSLKKGNYLIINGSEDKVIPPAGTNGLIAATPAPKKVVTINGGHINVDTDEIIDRLNIEVETWLASLGAINID